MHSGDLATMDERATSTSWPDQDLIIRGGGNIYPRSRSLHSHPGVGALQVVGARRGTARSDGKRDRAAPGRRLTQDELIAFAEAASHLRVPHWKLVEEFR